MLSLHATTDHRQTRTPIPRERADTMKPALSRFLCALAFLGACSGCTSARRGVQRVASSHLADTATSYNLAIEQTEDEMLLLNVIRAQDSYPLYLTDASKVTGTVKAGISLGLKIPLVHAGSTNDYFGMPAVEYSSSPSMDVGLLNSNDFMAGFLTPIPTELFYYYWDQGWGAEFLLYLLVLRVDEFEVKGAPDKPRLKESLRNQPDLDDSSLTDLRKFAGWVHQLVKDGRPLICPQDNEGAALGPPFAIKDLGALQFLMPALKEGFSLSPAAEVKGSVPAAAEGRWQLKQPKRTFFLATAGQCPTDIAAATIEAIASPSNQTTGPLPRSFAQAHVAAKIGGPNIYRLTLRSPEGMLYYLGQLTRLENRAGQALLIHACDANTGCGGKPGVAPPLTPLFVALDRKQHGACNSIIWVRSLDGSDYLIPKDGPDPRSIGPADEPLQLADVSGLCATGQSMHALTLLSQLIGLQKSVKDTPTTSTVKVVGQ
jgi:hypothetical protein